jgi:hypothetical protein
MRRPLKLASASLAIAAAAALAPAAMAGDDGDICGDLWYQRNAIYAAAGHCFKTKQGIAVFGKNCFPPYGHLNASRQSRVNKIIRQERKYGC